MTSCGCGAQWGGMSTCHCGSGGCHRTFTGITAFDAHRRGGKGCLLPSDVGLSLTDRDYPCWGAEDTGTNPWRTDKTTA